MGVKQILKKVVPEKIKFYIRLQLSRIRYRSLIKTTQKHYEELIENQKYYNIIRIYCFCKYYIYRQIK